MYVFISFHVVRPAESGMDSCFFGQLYIVFIGLNTNTASVVG